MILLKNQCYTVRIESWGSDGSGVCRIGGRAVFVSGAIPGERWEIKLVKVTASAVWARGMQLLEASPERCEPPCPLYGKCGGCALLHLCYEAELSFKLERVNEALRRIGGTDFRISEILGAEKTEGYRNKSILAVAQGADGPVAGFYRARSHDVIPAESCLLQSALSAAAAQAVLRWMRDCDIKPYSEADGKGQVRHIFTRNAFRTGEAMTCVVTARGFGSAKTALLVEELRSACPELTSIVLCVNKTRGNTVLGGEFHTLWGSSTITEELCDLRFELSPRSFFQINPPQAEKLYARALEYASPDGAGTVLDLYCGTGTISLCLARGATQVIGAEIVPEAVEDAKRNAERNGIRNVRFLCADASEAAAELAREGTQPDAVVVDPPRKGLSPDVIASIADMSPQRVVYVSCDPATLARDIGRFAAFGYAPTAGCAVDMFTHTAHVETVVCLSREKADESEKESNMISDERSKYKSWSNLKKQMNNLLCDSLKDKITYFYTSYHEVNNAYGRATINCNKKELVAFSWDIGYAKWDDEYTVLNETNVNIQTLGSFQAVWDEQKRVQEELNKSKWMPEGKLCETDFINAVTNYLKTDITTSLRSDNYLLRIFAYMDRRVGKRTLVKIQDEVEKLPDWVKQFYQIRCEADGIVFPPKRMADETLVLLSREDSHERIKFDVNTEDLIK